MFKAQIVFEVQKDDEPFCRFSADYAGMGYEHILVLEDKLLGMFGELQKVGEEKSKAKA